LAPNALESWPGAHGYRHRWDLRLPNPHGISGLYETTARLWPAPWRILPTTSPGCRACKPAPGDTSDLWGNLLPIAARALALRDIPPRHFRTLSSPAPIQRSTLLHAIGIRGWETRRSIHLRGRRLGDRLAPPPQIGGHRCLPRPARGKPEPVPTGIAAPWCPLPPVCPEEKQPVPASPPPC